MMSPLFRIFTILALILPTPTSASSTDITLLCDQIPDICTNICWAVRCARPPFPPTLTLDFNPGFINGHVPARNVTASCPTNMMCGPHGAGRPGHREGIEYRSCNVFPFPQTREYAGQRGHQVSRCVPEGQQREQNELLALLSRNLQLQLFQSRGNKKDRKQGATLSARINLGNPSGVPYCDNAPCRNDGYQVQDGAVKSHPAKDTFFSYYRTSSGLILASADEIETPYSFARPVGRDESVPVGVESWFEGGYAGRRVRTMGDVVVEKVDKIDL